jgi:hypothetical protein
MRKIILFTVIISLSGNLFPVVHRGLKWENMNCWMISVLSALINTKPLYEMLKNYEVKDSPGDTPELKIQKDILRTYIMIMNESFNKEKDPVQISSFYDQAYDLKYFWSEFHPASKGSFAESTTFMELFLKDINIAYPELQKIFFIASRDSMEIFQGYKKNDSCHRTCIENREPQTFMVRAGSWDCLDSKNEKMGTISAPFDLVKWSFVRYELPGKKLDICVQEKCCEAKDYKLIRFTAFKKAPRIMIFENSMQQGMYGVIIPDKFKIPQAFFVNPNHPSPNYKVYSMIIGSGGHFWNYSRDINSDEWWNYNYSRAEKVSNGTVENIMKIGKDDGAVPVLIFYEMENFEQYKLQANLSDLKESLIVLKTKLTALKSKLGLLKNKLVAH